MTAEIEQLLKEVTGYAVNVPDALQSKQKSEYNRLKSVLMYYPSAMHKDILELYKRYYSLIIKSADDKILKKVKKQLGEAVQSYKCTKISEDGSHLEIWYTQKEGNRTKNRRVLPLLPLTPPKTLQLNEEYLLFLIGFSFQYEINSEPRGGIGFLKYLQELCNIQKLNRKILSNLPPFCTEGVSAIEYANNNSNECISPKKFIRDIFQVEI